MKTLAVLLISLTIASCGVRTKVEPLRGAAFVPSHNQPVCLFAGGLPSEFKFIELGTIKATKRTYGSTDELTSGMADEARGLGADAIINMQAGQRFKGPLPWRITSPTGVGTAIKLTPESPKLECGTIGGRIA